MLAKKDLLTFSIQRMVIIVIFSVDYLDLIKMNTSIRPIQDGRNITGIWSGKRSLITSKKIVYSNAKVYFVTAQL